MGSQWSRWKPTPPAETAKGQRATMRLATVEAGRRVRIVGIQAGQALRARLTSMGLVPGLEIEVIQNGGQGPLVVMVRQGRIVLGRGMGQKIVVE